LILTVIGPKTGGWAYRHGVPKRPSYVDDQPAIRVSAKNARRLRATLMV
jgi:hypothetical protein